MIEARPSRIHRLVFDVYIKRLLKRHFHAFRILGPVPKIEEKYPLLVLPNHCSWWDGFFLYLLNDLLFQRPFYIMMLEDQLRHFTYFARLGAFSIDPGKPRKIRESLLYTADLLSNTTAPPIVSVFPQGELRPWGVRPLNYQGGIAWMAKQLRSPINVLSLGMRCELLDQQCPDMFFRFDENIVCDAQSFPQVAELERRQTEQLAQMNRDIGNGQHGTLLLAGKKSVSE